MKELLLIASHWIEIFWYLLSLDSQLLFLIGFVENYLRFAFFSIGIIFEKNDCWLLLIGLILENWLFLDSQLCFFSLAWLLLASHYFVVSIFFDCHWIHIVYGLLCLIFKKIWCWWLFTCFIVSLASFWRNLAVSSFLFAISQSAVENCCFIICFLKCFRFGKNSYCCLLICLFTHWLHICW